MNSKPSYRLSGLLPIRDSAPCFATPLFAREGSNGEYIQDIDRNMNLIGMIEPVLPSFPRPIRDIPSVNVQVAQTPYFAFVPDSCAPIFGTFSQLYDRLRAIGYELSNTPFVQRSVARFLSDTALEVLANEHIAERIGKDSHHEPSVSNNIEIPTVYIDQTVYRIIRSIFPPIDLFESIADPKDFEAIIEVESRTNTRLRGQVGNLDRVPPKRRVSGPGSSYIMAPFTHSSKDRPGKFSDGSFGFFCAADSIDAALADISWHRKQFCLALNLASDDIPNHGYRCLSLDLKGEVADLRGHRLHKYSWKESQALGKSLRASGYNGLICKSDYYSDGLDFVSFYPDLLSNARELDHVSFRFHPDGSSSYTLDEAGEI